MTAERMLSIARSALTAEARAVASLAVDDAFTWAARTICTCRGRVVVTGVGKSGHIGQTIASNFASDGVAAFFMHPTEAAHGDLGMIAEGDVVLMLSYSGETDELLFIAPKVKARRARLVAMTGNAKSSLARMADVHLDASVDGEACPFNAAPTCSTTAAKALGDALACAVADARCAST